ncbi:MAG: PAS domain S-box protein [Syntrophales bacterium]
MSESLRILILEDRPIDIELVQFELQEAGLAFISKVVMTEREYVRALQEFSPDLILSDYDLPQYNGALALAEARRRCPDTPFILVTGAVSEDRAIEILTQGAKDYVLKSRLQQRLVPAVRRALAEAEEQKARRKAEEELREAHKNLESQVAERTAELQKEIGHRRQIEEALLRYNERLELLSYTASRLLASDKPQQLVEELCLKVMEFLDCDAFFNFLVDENAGRLHLNACAGIPEEAVREIEWLDYGVAVCGCAARDACRIVAENIPMTPDVRTELVKSFGIKAYACHPLMEQNRVMGTLSFGTRSRTTFSTDDLALMKAVADQVAIAMVRVRTEDALRESEERYRELVQSSPDAVIVHRDGRFLYANPVALRLYGAESFEQLQSKTVLDLIHPDDRAFIALRMAQGKAGHRVPLEQSRLVRLDGRVVPVESVGGLVNYGGKPATQIVIRDISERRQAEAQLFETNQRLQALMQAVPVGVSFSDDTTCQRVTGNPAVLAQFDVRPEDNLSASAPDDRAPGRRVQFFRDGRRLSDAELPLQRAIAENKVIPPMELEVRLPSGRSWFVEASGAPVRDAQGNVIASLAVTVDITARKQAEAKLRRYELLADRHRDVILFIDLDGGRILEANDAAMRAYGYRYEQLLTMTIHDLRAADSRGLTADQITMAFDQGLLFEMVHRRQDGGTFPVEVSTQGAEIGGRRILISVVRDISERKRIERELNERTAALEERTRQMAAANKELESFSYSVSHDLRAPLRAIDGYSRMILRGQGDKFDENTRRQFNRIVEGARMMGQLIDDLLALSRLGREALSLSRINVEDLAREVWEELKVNNPDRTAEMKTGHIPPGAGDRSLIKQVFVNILANAMKFTKVRQAPLVEVGGYGTETENVYYVRDNGVGFDMEYHDKLFGVFQRLHSTEDYEGTGVGLAIVQRIIHRHGGRVWAEGKVDEGACFYFTLPKGGDASPLNE